MDFDESYLHGHHESVLRSHEWRTVENSAAYLVPYLTPGDRILDVGCGPGTITVGLADRVFPGIAIGMDFEPDMQRRAQSYASSAGCHNVEFHVGDVYHIEADDDVFDLVHAHQVLQHVADPISALREMIRVTKPGGIIAARDVIYSSTSWSPDSDGLDRWLATYIATARFAGGDPDIGRSLHALALTAGAKTVASSASAWCYSTPAERDWWGNSWATRATESGFARNAIEAGAAGPDDLKAIAQAWKDWAADERGWLAMMHGEIIAYAPPSSGRH